MKKKNIIALSVIVGIFLCIGIVFAMVFTLHKIEFQATTYITKENRSRLFANGQTVNGLQENILTEAEFNKGGNLLFMNFDQNIKKIEEAIPFIKVEKIVRAFPNKITVYYSEREAVALIPVAEVSNGYYVVDSDLKVLDYVSQANEGKYISTQTSNIYDLPIINYYSESHTTIVGKNIDSPELQKYIEVFVSGAFSAYGQLQALYEDIFVLANNITFETKETTNKVCTYSLTAQNGSIITFEVWEIDVLLYDKISLSWELFFRNYRENNSSQDITIKVFEDKNTNRVTLVDTSNNQQLEIFE